MKKLLATILIGAMSFSLAACGGGTTSASETPSEATSEAPSEATSEETSEAPSEENSSDTLDLSDFSIGMITDVGGVNDQSFNQSAWEGLQALKADTGANVSYLESEQEANYASNLDIMVDSEVNVIWGIGYMMADAVANAANSNPTQSYAIVDSGYEVTPSNLTSVLFRAEEPSFLVGYMASYTTESNIVGYVGGISSDTIDQFEFGYKAGVAYGAKEQDKEVEVLAQYANSFSDAAIGKAIATSMFTDGADIVFHAAGNVGQGVIEAAKDLGKLAIGVDRDQSDLAPENVMTSAMKLVGAAMQDVSKRIVAGEELGGQTLSYGLSEEAAGIPPYEGSTANLVEKPVYDATIALQGDIVSGAIKVPNNLEDYEAFAAGL